MPRKWKYSEQEYGEMAAEMGVDYWEMREEYNLLAASRVLHLANPNSICAAIKRGTLKARQVDYGSDDRIGWRINRRDLIEWFYVASPGPSMKFWVERGYKSWREAADAGDTGFPTPRRASEILAAQQEQENTLTAYQVAAWLGIAYHRVCRMAIAGELPGESTGSRWIFRRDTLERWIADRGAAVP
jgi:excisionase family DNA binding protein